MAYSGQSIDEGDVREAWSKKWAASEAVAEEANDEKERLAATEALADTMYRDFFDGDDPFGVLEEDDSEEEVERSPRRQGSKRGSRGRKGGRAARREAAAEAEHSSAV